MFICVCACMCVFVCVSACICVSVCVHWHDMVHHVFYRHINTASANESNTIEYGKMLRGNKVKNTIIFNLISYISLC